MFRRLTLLAALAATAMTPALAQRRVPTPEERIERLEKQVNQVQRRVYGKQPVDTAGYTMDPAVTQSDLANVTQRLDSIERQMADLVRTSEENSNRVATLEAQLLQMRAAADRREREAPVEAEPATDPTVDGNAYDDGAPPPRSGPKYENRDEPQYAVQIEFLVRLNTEPLLQFRGDLRRVWRRGSRLTGGGQLETCSVELERRRGAGRVGQFRSERDKTPDQILRGIGSGSRRGNACRRRVPYGKKFRE